MKAKFFDLKNKRVIITGGSSGIGAEIVKKFCEQDSEVFFIDINGTMLDIYLIVCTTGQWERLTKGALQRRSISV